GTIIILQRNFYIEKEKRMIKATDIVLKRSENKYKSLFEGATDALMLLEKSKGFIDGNRGTIQLFQAPSIEKFKEVNPVILSPKYQPDGISSEKKAAQMIEKAFKNGEHCFEWLHKRFNGEEFPASVQLTRLNWTHRNILLAAVRDMTERNKLEEHLRHNQKMELIGQLAGGFAHDFNNMLNSIGGVGELLQNKYQTDKSTLELVSILTKATEKAASLTGKMLAFSRKAKIITKPLDIHSTIKDAILFLERSINKKIEINKRFTAKKSIVNGDLGQLENAILNICLNASDAMPDGGKISIVTENFEVNNKFSLENELENGTYIKINITDTGTGMDKNTLKHIFEPFFTTKNIGEGTGLGLSAVYGTIKEHKGLLLCESKINHGTIFSIFLPIDENAVVKKTKRNVSVDEKMSKKRILLIDDESIFRKMMEQLLKTINCDVTSAEDGVKGIEIYKEKQAEIDLSIIDQRMPKLTGVETYKKLKEINPEIKVVFISGFTECKEISIVVNEPNVLGFLQKPFKSEELKEILNKA
ncbi:MAG: response regulator, partial [Verrucomicrobiota bacterium]|nr:response regulator [Verrucomicrobiota bacterium]